MNIKKIKPLFTSIVTTMDKYEEDAKIGSLIDTSKREGSIKEYQTVLAIGPSVRDIKVGDLVSINPTRFARKKHQEGTLKDNIITDNPIVSYEFDIIELDKKPCLLLQDRDIDFVVEEWEESPPPSSLVLPEEKKIII